MCHRLISLYTKLSFFIMQVFIFLSVAIYILVYMSGNCVVNQGAVYQMRIDSMKMYIL